MIFTAGFFQLTGSFDNFLFSCTLVRQYRPLPARTGRLCRNYLCDGILICFLTAEYWKNILRSQSG